MPHIIQICNYTTVTNTMAEEAWVDLTHYLQGKFGLKTTDYYGGSPDFTTAARTGGRDIIFVVMLDDTPIRTERDTADRALQLRSAGHAGSWIRQPSRRRAPPSRQVRVDGFSRFSPREDRSTRPHSHEAHRLKRTTTPRVDRVAWRGLLSAVPKVHGASVCFGY